MYDFSWHQKHSAKTDASAKAALSIIREVCDAKSVLDIGCGDGIWLRNALDLGFEEVRGVDGPWTDVEALRIPPSAFTMHDLEKSIDLARRFDIAISLEVAEHISRDSAHVMVDNLVRHSDVVIFGAAIPYQGGFRHINEMWQSWWADLFAERGYRHFDVIRPQIWHRGDVHFWYKQNILVYVNRNSRDRLDMFDSYVTNRSLSAYPLDIVHPEKYEAAASYKEIAFKPLMRELPSGVVNKLKSMLLRQN